MYWRKINHILSTKERHRNINRKHTLTLCSHQTLRYSNTKVHIRHLFLTSSTVSASYTHKLAVFCLHTFWCDILMYTNCRLTDHITASILILNNYFIILILRCRFHLDMMQAAMHPSNYCLIFTFNTLYVHH